MNNLSYQKYIKYKTKYLNLKNKLGGSSPVLNEYYIPSEINNYTKRLIISNKDSRNVLEQHLTAILPNIEIVRANLSSNFAQDPFIIFKNNSEPDNTYAIGKFFGDQSYNMIDITSLFEGYEYTNSLHYGGNFISSPNNIVFTFDNSTFTESLRTKMDVVSLECTFKSADSRHIDETMCFMPYGFEEYKVWFYKPDLSDNILSLEIFNEVLTFYEKTKLKMISDGILNQTEHDHKFIKHAKFRQHWYSIENKYYQPKYIKSLLLYFSEIDINLINQQIIDEHQRNLDIISNKLFKCNYSECKNNFVLFDLKIKYEFDSRINNLIFQIDEIPIFNRLLVETETNRHIIFPIVSSRMQSIVDREKPFIKSYLNDQPFTFSNINTRTFNDEGKSSGSVGGNIHCLIKNQY